MGLHPVHIDNKGKTYCFLLYFTQNNNLWNCDVLSYCLWHSAFLPEIALRRCVLQPPEQPVFTGKVQRLDFGQSDCKMGLLTRSRDNIDPPLLRTADSTNVAVKFTLYYQQCHEAEELLGTVQTLSCCHSVPVLRYTSCHKHCYLRINPKHDFGTDEAGVLNFSNSLPLNQQRAVGLLYSVSCGLTVCAVCYIGLCGYNISIKTWAEVKLWQSIH